MDPPARPSQLGHHPEQSRQCTQALGEREIGTARLEEAVTAYREALLEWTRQRVPLNWATTQNNLGNALRRWGSANPAQTASKRPSTPTAKRSWNAPASASARLGHDPEQSRQRPQGAGPRETGTERRRRGPRLPRSAPRMNPARVPLNWAMTQNNLGNALTRSDGSGITPGIARSRRAYREASGTHPPAHPA